MAGSVNKVILVGRLGADPEIRHAKDGKAIVNLRLATSESWRDKNSGERREKNEWHSIVIFNEHIGKIAQQYLKKGSECYLSGKLVTRKWQDNAGNDRYTTEVVLENFNGELTLLGGGKRDDGEDRSQERGYGIWSPKSKPASSSKSGSKMDWAAGDDMPF